MLHQHVLSQFGLGGQTVPADGADGLAAVPRQMLAPAGTVGQNLAAARHRTERSHTCKP